MYPFRLIRNGRVSNMIFPIHRIRTKQTSVLFCIGVDSSIKHWRDSFSRKILRVSSSWFASEHEAGLEDGVLIVKTKNSLDFLLSWWSFLTLRREVYRLSILSTQYQFSQKCFSDELGFCFVICFICLRIFLRFLLPLCLTTVFCFSTCGFLLQ